MSNPALDTILDRIDRARPLRETDDSAYQTILEQARQELTILAKETPDDAKLSYECASVHDMLGLEREAVPFYEEAIRLGTLSQEDLRGAYLGLGSTYRCIGEYEKSIMLLAQATEIFPEDHSLRVFLALAKYNAKDWEGAMQLLLDSLLETSTSEHIRRYSRAIRYYRDHLDEVW